MSSKNARKAYTSDPGSENSSENEGPPFQNSKRQKLDAGGASSSSTTQQLMLAGRLKSGEDGYVDGSIIRVTLKNFVTYEACEFRPGPHLNMIVGPNGTGKSTAVCAMALGLGGNTTLLGRAKDISEFVKTGKDNASIEIELRHRGRGGNIIIKRQIKKSKNSSIWQINGQQTTQKEVLAKVNSLSIQVDNLCQFLPQDKVCEFAQMTPPELLRETQKAAGNKELSLWHEQLIVKRTEQKTLQSSVRSDTDALATLESRTAVLERDWLRFQEREKILKKVKLLENGIYLARYGQAKENYDIAKKSRVTAFNELKRLERSNAPVEELRSQLKAAVEEATAAKKRLSEQFSKKYDQIKEKNTNIELSENECDEIKHELEALKRKEKQRREKMAALRHEVEDLERRFSGEAPSADVSAVQPNIDAISLQIRDGTQRVQDLQAQQSDIMDEGKELYRQINQKVKQLEDLKNIRIRRLNLLGKIDVDCHKVALWLENNQYRFEKHVFGPVCLEINVRDQQYVDAIEFGLGGVGSNEMKMFVCQTQQDYKLFTAELIDGMKLRVSATWLQSTLEHYRAPMNIEQLRYEYGLDHYILDLIDGPPPVLCLLCENMGVHRLPITLRDSDSMHIADKSGLPRFIIKDENFIVKQSVYGARNRFTIIKKVSRATMLTDSVDINVQRTLQTDLDCAREKLSQNEGRMKALKEEENKCRRTDEELRAQREALNKRKKEIQATKTQWERNKLKLEAKRQQLEDDFKRPNVSDQEEADLKRKLHGHAVKRGKFSLEYKNLIQESVELFAQRNIAYLQYIQTSAELRALETRCREKDAELEQANADLQRAEAAFKRAKEHAKKCLDEATKISEEMDDETKEEWRTLSIGRTLEQIEDEIATEKAKADAKYATNPRVLEDYNRRKRETDQLRGRLASTEKQLEKLTNDINVIKSKWQPRLQQLVDRISQGFSTAFDRIGCAGEVRVSDHEDYDKWGIDILVKFRDNEKLQILTGQRQSGGERSVSTILYLMALQELAKAPFRVVDEINQGMDPRNERLIHSQLVEVACRPNTPQYFLITPKLLPDLDYHERMRVLCIFNGEYQPEKLKLRSYIDMQKRRMA